MQRELESLVMERKGSLVKGKKGKKISKQGHHLWGEGGEGGSGSNTRHLN